MVDSCDSPLTSKGRCVDKPFPAYEGDEPYVFVCYAHDDEATVFPDIQWLREQGITLWYDEGISAGKVWRAEILKALQGASKVLYYISAASLQSILNRAGISGGSKS